MSSLSMKFRNNAFLFRFLQGGANAGASQVQFYIRYENPRKNIKERDMISILAMYGAVGAVAGILAGLLGIGGGLVIVPMLVFCFSRQGISDQAIMHLALGTSMASIMFTAVSSFWSHHRRGAVRWLVVRHHRLCGERLFCRRPARLFSGLRLSAGPRRDYRRQRAERSARGSPGPQSSRG